MNYRHHHYDYCDHFIIIFRPTTERQLNYAVLVVKTDRPMATQQKRAWK